MFINVPFRLKKNDIKQIGTIYKGNSYSYILSDFKNRNSKSKLELKSRSFFDRVYDVLDTYLFIADGLYDKKISYIDEILRFEYELKCVKTKEWTSFKDLQKLPILNKTFMLLDKERYIKEDYGLLEHYNYENDHIKSEFGLVKTMFADDYVIVRKSKNIGGHIIKYEHSKFGF